jgi:hypothetical protein
MGVPAKKRRLDRESVAADSVEMLGIALEIRTQCGACGGPLLVNGLVPQVVCPACNTPKALDAAAWKTLIEDAFSEAPVMPLNEGRTSQILASATGSAHVMYGHQNPRCSTCKTDVPLDDVGALVARGFAMCTGCGRRLSLRWAPPELLCALASGPVLAIGEDPSLFGSAGGLAVAPAAAQPVVFTCPQCAAALPVDGGNRTVVCDYCRANVYLPDDLWRQLHPVKTAQRWYLWLDRSQIRVTVDEGGGGDDDADAGDRRAAETLRDREARLAELRARAQASGRKVSVIAVLIPIFIPLLIVGGIFGGSWYSAQYGRADRIGSSYVLPGGRGPVLATLEEVHANKGYAHRLSVVDARTGQRRARVSVGGGTTLIGASGGVLWVYDNRSGIAAYDGQSGRLLLDEDDFLRRNPGLRGRLMTGRGGERFYAIDSGRGLAIRTSQGHAFRVPPGSWVAARVGGTPDLLKTRPDRFVECWSVKLGDAYWRLDGEHRKRLVDSRGRAIGARDGFLEASFVCRDTGDQQPLTLAKPDSLVLLQKTSLDSKATDVVTRVALDGRVLWTTSVGVSARHSEGGIFLSEHRLIVVGHVEYRRYQAVALDARTGRLLWRYEF